MNMREIAKEIIEIKLSDKDVLKECSEKFYNIMRKYNIKYGTKNYNKKGKEIGISCANYEWTMCHALFIDRIITFFDFKNMLEIPEDLKC